MEVASPLTFSSAGAKRHYPGSPGFVDPNISYAMMDASATNVGDPDSTNQFIHQPRAFKRRRFATIEDSAMESDNTENSQNHAFPMHAMVARGPFSTPACKRSRTDANNQLHLGEDLRKIVETQAAEISSLKSEKAGLENSFNALKGEHDKVVYENRTLKRAVLIQQERQNHACSELNAAQQYKAEAEDKIKKLEQLVLSLRYHLQAHQNNTPSNDFMGFPPRPPDVY
ncbi:hypothetical protein IV203_034931 [Nitzschia inconspicua]|uniref:Uncharacterized protein n=1 Tax=Nitzschia inconspicua TaxID=303405 RepID=A0A9K3PUC1_9STRA|nr:hypothetical protein IV203_034931 [Nitzschia inconspicua]